MKYPFPVIRLELEGMKYAIIQSLAAHMEAQTEDMKKAVQDAVDAFDPLPIIRAETHKGIEEAIKLSVQNFFTYGEGRDAVCKAVDEHLRKALEPKHKGAKR